MATQPLQTFIRRSSPASAHVDTYSVDALGRMLGGYNTIEVEITAEERAVIDAIEARACAAQDAVEVAAAAEIAAGRTPTQLIATPAEDARRARAEANRPINFGINNEEVVRMEGKP